MRPTLIPKNSLSAAQQHILMRFNAPNVRVLPVYNYRTAALWAEQVLLLGASEAVCPPETLAAAAVAAWFGTIGQATNNCTQAHDCALTLLEQFLYEYTSDTIWILQTLRCLEQFQTQRTPETLESRLLHDAWAAVQLAQPLDVWQKNILTENHLLQQAPDTIAAIQVEQLAFWQTVRCYTAEGKIRLESLIGARVEALSAQMSQQKRSTDKPDRTNLPFEKAGKGNLRNASQTYFRVTFGNHIHLSQIADNKAHMLISINSVLVSVVVSVLTYKNLAQTTPIVLLPMSIFVLSALVSLTLAVLSVRPRVTNVFHQLPEVEQRKAIAFFGNFTQLDLPTFETWTDELLSNRSLLYQNLTHDLYHLGKVLAKKYRLLQYSYQVFLIGFVAATLLLVGTLYFW